MPGRLKDMFLAALGLDLGRHPVTAAQVAEVLLQWTELGSQLLPLGGPCQSFRL